MFQQSKQRRRNKLYQHLEIVCHVTGRNRQGHFRRPSGVEKKMPWVRGGSGRIFPVSARSEQTVCLL